MAKFLENYVDVDCFACSYVQCSKFSFCDRGHDMFNDVCNVENSTVVWWDVCIGGEEKMAAGAAACSWYAEVAGITVC